jgi:hypothetical protein
VQRALLRTDLQRCARVGRTPQVRRSKSAEPACKTSTGIVCFAQQKRPVKAKARLWRRTACDMIERSVARGKATACVLLRACSCHPKLVCPAEVS